MSQQEAENDVNSTTCVDRCSFNESSHRQFSCQQLDDYCRLYQNWLLYDDWLQRSINYVMSICGILGLIGYVLMGLTLRRMTLETASYIYYQSIVVMELVHMLVMTESGIARLAPLPNSYWKTIWYDQFGCAWYIGDWMKLSVTVLVACLSLERTVAVVSPLFYRNLNRNWVAWTAVWISTVLGTIYLPGVAGKQVIYRSGVGYVAVWSEFGLGKTMLGFTNAQYICKLSFSVCIFVLSCVTVYGLCNKARKAKSLSVEDRRAWKGTYRLTGLSLIVGISTLVDNLCWTVFRYFSLIVVPPLGAQAVAQSSFQEATSTLDFVYLQDRTKITQVVMGAFVHCGRFYLYLALNKAFRNGFYRSLRIYHGIVEPDIVPEPVVRTVSQCPA